MGEGTHWWPQGWLGKMVLSYVKGNLLLFKFYLANISKLHQLPQVIFDKVLQSNQDQVLLLFLFSTYTSNFTVKYIFAHLWLTALVKISSEVFSISVDEEPRHTTGGG